MSTFAVEATLEYMYYGTCSLESADSLAVMVKTASRLQVPTLLADAVDALIDRLTPASCIDAWQLSEQLALPVLEEAAIVAV